MTPVSTRLTLAAAVLAAIPCTTLLADDGADGHGPLPPPAVQKPAPQTLGQRFGAWFIPPPTVMLDAMDHGKLMAEDDPSDKGRPFRFGVERLVRVTMQDGQWIDVEGGRLWRVELDANGALNSRLHLEGLNLTAGQQMALVSPDHEQLMVGILEGKGDFGNGAAYGMFSAGGRQVIEWFVPTGQQPAALPFDQLAYCYGYREVFGVVVNGGTCSNDPACYPTWVNESNAACKLAFTSGGGSYICSGQLMSTTAADETPYVSTANHCISTASEANSCQFIFFYRSPTCGSATSAGTTVTAADLSGTYATSDCTLLRVKGALPSGVYWAGWMTTNPANGTASVGIHHPSGTPQAISFANKAATNNFCGSGSNWSAMGWTSGITEGGSSGSAIYQASDRRMYGVLTCGSSACNNTSGQDGYGRWDVAVNTASTTFATQLAAGADDTLENNDTCATAKVLGSGTYSGLVVKRLDEDWYSVDVPVGSTLGGTFTYTHAYGDIDIQVFNTCGGTAVVNLTGNVNNDTLNYVNPGPGTTLLIRVYLASDTRADYSMTLNTGIAAPANDTCATAIAATNGNYAFNNAAATTDAVTIPASCNEGSGVTMNNDVWYRYTATCAGTASASTCGNAAFDTRIAVYPGSACPTSATAVTACSDNFSGCAGSTSKATWAVTAGSTWYVRVGAASTGTGSATVAFACQQSCVGNLNTDNQIDGSDLGILLASWGGAAYDLNGDGTVNGADLGIMLANWGPCP